MAPKLTPSRTDPGLQQIADLERAIVEASEQTWRTNGVDAATIAQLRPNVAALAKAVADQLRDNYRAGSAQP